MGRPFPSAEGTGFAARRATGCGDPHQRLSALRPPRMGANPPRRPGARSPGTMEIAQHDEPRSTNCMSCPAKARHPALTDVSDCWIARMRGDDGRELKRLTAFW